MKFLLDAHIPMSVASCFKGHTVIHTSELPDGNLSTDQYINKYSEKNKFIVITKDSDFYYSYLSSGIPYKLVYVKIGNMKLEKLIEYFEANVPVIIQLLEENYFIILEKDKIRAID